MACPNPTMPTNIDPMSAIGQPAEACLAAGKWASSACERRGSTTTALKARSMAADSKSVIDGSGALKDLKVGAFVTGMGADDSGEAWDPMTTSQYIVSNCGRNSRSANAARRLQEQRQRNRLSQAHVPGSVIQESGTRAYPYAVHIAPNVPV